MTPAKKACNHKLIQPFTYSKQFKYSFFVSAISAWSSLPANIMDYPVSNVLYRIPTQLARPSYFVYPMSFSIKKLLVSSVVLVCLYKFS